MCASLKKIGMMHDRYPHFATLYHQGLKTTWIPTRSSQILLTQGHFLLILVKVMLQKTIRNDDF